MNDLQLATNDELIEELWNRGSFAGIVLQSRQNQKFSGQVHGDFRMMTTSDRENSILLLEQALDAVRNLAPGVDS